ncbi:hypothetical protein D3C86_1295890 [compost metagenome]
MQYLGQGGDGGRRIGAVFLGRAETLPRDQIQRPLVGHGQHPRMSRRAARQPGVRTHFRVIAQAVTRALRLGDPGQALVVDDRQPHQFTRNIRQAIHQRLGDVDDAGRGQIAQADGRHAGGQRVVAMVADLPHVAATAQVGQQAVRRALRNIQLLGKGCKRNTFWSGREVFHDGERAFEDSGHGISTSRG